MALLDTLYLDCPGYLDLRAIKKGEHARQGFYLPTDHAGIKAWIASNNGFNLYFGVATRDGKAGTKENIIAIPALFVDLDFKRLPGEESGAIRVLESFPFFPTVIVHSGGGYHCVPLDTEILTIDGWKRFNEVVIGETVLGYDREEDKLDWTSLEGKIIKENDELVKIKNDNFSVVCTPDHNWVCDVYHGHQSKKLSRNELVPAKQITRRRHRIILSAEFSNNKSWINITITEAAILGWFASEGSVTKKREGTGQTYRITQRESTHGEEIRSLLEGIPYKEYRSHSDKTLLTFSINPSWFRSLWTRCGFDADKNEADWTRFVLGLEDLARDRFIDSFFKGDGTINRGGKVIYQKRGPIFDAVQLAVFLSGHYPSVNASMGRSAEWIRYTKPSRRWDLEVSPFGRSAVWCPKTGLGTWVMRQGDVVCITGNCYWKLREPEGKESIDKVEAIHRGITARLGSDMGSVDASHILRIPNTKNYNYLPPRPVYLKHSNGSEYSLNDFEDFVAEDPGPKRNQANYSEKNSERLDKIMSCRFMQHWMNDSATLPEPDWYCGLTQLIRDPGGIALIHKYSKRYPKYSKKETDAKILHAINATGPMTCDKIFKDTGFVCEDPDCRAKAPAGRGLIENEESPYDDTKEPVSSVSAVSSVSGESERKQSVSNGKQTSACVSKSQQEPPSATSAESGGITSQLREWIKDSMGSFTVHDVDREFNLRTRTEKNARSRALNKILSENIIVRDRVVKGKYHIMDLHVEFDDRNKPMEDVYPLAMPLNLDKMVIIPPKSIVVVAGATNAGKTALLFTIAKMNLFSPKKMVYVRSEMSAGEFFSRQRTFRDVPESDWDRMKSTERSTGFNAVIWNYNRDGITFVDFLEDVGGEYGKMPDGVRQIYDALGNGIAIIALQKKTGLLYGRGGEGTAEKARLYLSVDKLLDCHDCIICSATIVKAKVSIPDTVNHSGKEIHFRLIRGSQIIPITEWSWIKERQRNSLIERYRREYGEKDSGGVRVNL